MDPLATIPPPLPVNFSEDSHKGGGSISMSDDDAGSNVTSAPIRERLNEALNLKSDATVKLNEDNISRACEIYKEALEKLGADDEETDTEEVAQRVKKTRVALNLNLALCHVKMEKWIDAIRDASAVLKVEDKNVKALYRRGLARCRTGFLEEARKDLMKAHELDKGNVEIRRELHIVKDRLIEARAKEKEKYGGLFAKAEGLYADKAGQVEKQKQLEAQKLQEEMKNFEEDNKKRELAGEKPFESFSKWKEEKKKEAKESSDSGVKDASNNTAHQRSKTRNDTAVDLDEEEQKILMETKKMGYCYFNRPNQNSSVERNVPTKIEVPSGKPEEDSKRSLSSWNAAGTTYEELDCSSWCRAKLGDFLKQSQASDSSNYEIHVDSVTSVNGEAQIVVLRSSKRYLYDLSCQITWKLKVLPCNSQITGVMDLTDISSTIVPRTVDGVAFPEWLAEATSKITTPDYDEKRFSNIVNQSLFSLKKDICARVKLFEESFKEYA